MKKNLILLLLSIFTSSNIFSQGFFGIHTSDAVNVIAVGQQGKIFRSSNGGTIWAGYTINPAVDYKSVFTSGDLIWVSGSNGSIYKSSFSGFSLTEISTGVFTSLNSVSFINSLNGFACGNNGVLLKTTNSGNNWISSNSGIGTAKLNSVSFLDLQNGAVAGDSGKIFLTTDGGATWQSQVTGTTRNLLKIKFFATGIAVAGEYGTLLLRPQSGSWQSVATRINTDIRGISGTSFTNINVCGGGGFIRNNRNNKNTFSNFQPNPMLADLSDIIFADSLTGFAVSSLTPAIIKTSTGGVNWNLTAGTTAVLTWNLKLSTTGGIGNNLCMHPSDRNSIFVMYGNRVYISQNRGENWSQISSTSLGTNAHSFYVSPLDTNVWVCAIESSTDKVIRSTDYGTTWNTILTMNFSNYGQPLEMDQNNPSVYYFAPDAGGFYKSTNNGATFAEISGNYPFRSPCDIMVMHDSSNVIFLADGVTGSGLGEIFKTVNGGANWVKVFTNSSSSEIPSMSNSVFDKSTMYATNWPGGNIYRTVDFGDNWTLLRTNPSSGWASDICREDPTLIMTGSYGSSTFISTDAGANFSTYTIGGGAGAGMIAPERGFLINMQTGGLFKLSAVYTVVTETQENIISNIPKEFALNQNYPNPFNPSTRINFTLPKSGYAVLRVFDQLGREVKVLVDGYKSSGIYEINFNASGLSSGLYFYRLESGGNISTKKMLLIK